MDKTDFLIFGEGIQEHVFAWKLKRSPRVGKIFAIPGNIDMACRRVDIAPTNFPEIIKFIESSDISSVFAGNSFLKEDLMDYLGALEVRLIAYQKQAIAICTSRAAMRDLLRPRGVPFPLGHVLESVESVRAYCDRRSFPLILKADKVGRLKSAVCQSPEDVDEYLTRALQDTSSDRIIIENPIAGPVIAISAVVVEHNIMTLPYCRLLQKNYRIIGASIPVSLSDKMVHKIERLIVVPLIHALDGAVSGFEGIITMEIAVTPQGPYLLDWSVPWGDVTAAALLANLQTDILDLLSVFPEKKLDGLSPEWSPATVALLLEDFQDFPGNSKVAGNWDSPSGPWIFTRRSSHDRFPPAIAIVVNADDIAGGCSRIMEYWEKNRLPENYDLYTGLQMAKQSVSTITGEAK